MHRQELWIPRVKAIITDTTKAMALYQAVLRDEETQQQRYETREIFDPMLSVIADWQEITSEQYWEQEKGKAAVRVVHIGQLKSLLALLQSELDHQYNIIEEEVLDHLLANSTAKIPSALSLLHWCDWSAERQPYCRQFGIPFSESLKYEHRSFMLRDQDLRQAIQERLLGLQPREKALDLRTEAHRDLLSQAVDYYMALFIDTFSSHQSIL